MPHSEYPHLPEGILELAKLIRSADWNGDVWVNQPEKWKKSAPWRQWSIERAHAIVKWLQNPSDTMISAGAEVLFNIYETETSRKDTKDIFVAIIKSMSKKPEL